MEKQTIGITIPVNKETVLQLLTSALCDGAADYWLAGVALNQPATVAQAEPIDWSTVAWNPVNGGSIIITAPHPQTDVHTDYVIDGEAIQRGLAIMASQYPHHFVDVMKEDTDDTTGDVFVQCCIYGEIVYS